MTEVYYLPLKSAGGAIVGHARIAGGMAKLQLKRPVQGQAVVFSEDGTWFGDTEEEICVHGKLCAVAVLEEGRLLCCGIPREQQTSFSELQRQLERPVSPICVTREEPAVPADTNPIHAPTTPPAEAASVPTAIECCSEPPAEGAKPLVLHLPKHAVRKRVRQQPIPPVSADTRTTTAMFTPIPQEASAPQSEDDISIAVFEDALKSPDTLPETNTEELLLFDGRDGLHAHTPSLADSAADSEAFAALLRRAELVFESIEAPHPPLVTERKRSAARYADGTDFDHAPISQDPGSPAGTAAQRSWGQEVELLLGKRPTQSKTATENPFPHIFPNAVFYRIGGSGVQPHLEGEWMSGGEHMHIYAMPGTYSPEPPTHLKGYTRFIRTQQGSYWVRVTSER